MSDGFSDILRPLDVLTITDRELFERLRWFTQVRWLFGLGTLGLLLVSWHVLGVRFHRSSGEPTIGLATGAAVAIFLYNAVFTFLCHMLTTRGVVRRRQIVLMAWGQLSCDLVATFLLVHFTGGVENFFLLLVLLPMVIAIELLPRKLVYIMATVTAVLVNALAWGEQMRLLPHVSIEFVHDHQPGYAAGLYANPLYVLHVTTAMTVTIFAMAFIASSIAARLRDREAELQETYNRLNAADEAKSFFMRKAGHEMRAPLAAMQSILDAIGQMRLPLAAEHRQLLGRAKTRLQAMMGLIDDLRRYSRLRSGQPLRQTERLRFDEIVLNTVELFRRQAVDAELTLLCRVKPACVDGEEETLSQVVTNLVANAIQYTPPGGRIDVALTVAGDRAVLAVADTGIGVSQDALGRIFEEFYRSPEAKRQFAQGTGLGLAITKRIVEMHGGRIEAAPCPEGGTVFTVRLPIQPGEA